jgi:RNA polymerase sigma-70 factor (ECF subfamily)
LPERQREIVLLHYYLDASVADTAAAMGISEGTVKTQLHRARAKLADALGLAEEESA